MSSGGGSSLEEGAVGAAGSRGGFDLEGFLSRLPPEQSSELRRVLSGGVGSSAGSREAPVGEVGARMGGVVSVASSITVAEKEDSKIFTDQMKKVFRQVKFIDERDMQHGKLFYEKVVEAMGGTVVGTDEWYRKKGGLRARASAKIVDLRGNVTNRLKEAFLEAEVSSDTEGSILEMFKPSDLWETRKDPELFKLLCRQYFSAVVFGRKGSYGRRMANDLVSQVLNPSDEAFVYLVLENNYAYWKTLGREMMDSGKVLSMNMKDRVVQPKYTHARNSNNMSWNRAGKLRYVEFLKMVIEDRNREGAKELEVEVRGEWQIANGGRRRRDRLQGESQEEEEFSIPIVDDNGNPVVIEEVTGHSLSETEGALEVGRVMGV